MKKIEKLYCGDSAHECTPGKICVDGKCVDDIAPPPPAETIVKESNKDA